MTQSCLRSHEKHFRTLVSRFPNNIPHLPPTSVLQYPTRLQENHLKIRVVISSNTLKSAKDTVKNFMLSLREPKIEASTFTI